MGTNLYKKAIKIIPDLFVKSFQNESDYGFIFDKISKILTFSSGYIFFISPDSIQQKFSYIQEKPDNQSVSFQISPNLKDFIFSQENFVFDSSHPLIKSLQLKGKSFVQSKLSIRGTIFGFILLESDEQNFYSADEAEILDAFASVVSYLIKDVELSNVFKIQLRALKEGIVETNSAYKTIKEQNIKILEADKVKNEFLANISHELRTPLNAIIGFSEVLGEKLFGELNEKQTEYVNDIHVSGIHLLGMINEILDISKIEANAMTINKSEFLLSKAIDEVMNVIKPLAIKKQIKLNKKVTDGKIFADYQKLSQILYNLLSNAIKFSFDGGGVDVDAAFSENKFVIRISDSGIGIDEKYHGKIFAKFVQLENSYTKKESSTGLGLTITKQLVEMHEGTITLKSAVNQGTTFIVEIPNA